METKRRLSELSELPRDPPNQPPDTKPEDAKLSEDLAPTEFAAYPDGLSAAPSDAFLGGSPRIADDGRVNIDLNSKLIKTLSVIYGAPQYRTPNDSPPEYSRVSDSPDHDRSSPVKLNVVIQIIGSRGDVQPFIALGHELRRYGHRVRIAIHNMFEDFVRNSGSGLEFYPIGGNPSELMAYMVKNPGLIPSLESLQAGEIKKKRLMIREMHSGSPDVYYALDKHQSVPTPTGEPPQYEPPAELQIFLESGSSPVYIGFGSIVLEDPQRITSAILGAVQAKGFRAIVSKGWSNLGGQGESHKDVLFIGDCPHEWLFQHVAAVVHHGGAGTTTCGLKNSKPTTIVPFFGDQPFWGRMVAAAGAGPMPIPQGQFTTESLSEAISYCLSNEAARAAAAIAQKMQLEVGVEAAARSFHRNLPIENMSCDVAPHLPAAFCFNKGKDKIKLSSFVAELVCPNGSKNAKHLKWYESKPINIETRRWDPISGGASAVLGTAVDLTTSVTGVFTKPITEYRDDRDRRAYEQANMEALEAANNKAHSAGPSESKSDDASRLAGASGMSIAMFAPKALKGMTVDIPLAPAEGLKNVPQHYGDTPRDHGPVTGFKSGATVAGKTFAWGFIDGVSDMVVKPYQGAQKEGMKGAAKGLGKGVVSMATKSGAGMFGLFGYTSAGIAKSLRTAVFTSTRKEIAEARHAEAKWLVKSSKYSPDEIEKLITSFKALVK
ncbi:UDP-glucose,sterol transferase [Paraphaeosphaeria sporulosa]